MREWLALFITLYVVNVGLPINNMGLSIKTLRATRFRTSGTLKPNALPSAPLVVKSKLHPALKPILDAMLATLGGL